MCRASSDDDDDDNDDEFNFDNLFVSHLDDILSYTVRRTKGSVTMTLADRKMRIGLADTLLHDMAV